MGTPLSASDIGGARRETGASDKKNTQERLTVPPKGVASRVHPNLRKQKWEA